MGIKLRVKLCEAGAVAHLLSLASFYLRVHRYLKKKKKKACPVLQRLEPRITFTFTFQAGTPQDEESKFHVP